MSKREVYLWLKDISDAIHHIRIFTEDLDLDGFIDNIQVKHAVLHNFTIIGEASAKIPDGYKMSHAEIGWREIKGFRNYVVHEYFGLDDNIVWDIIQQDIPQLHVAIEHLVQEEFRKF